MSDLNIKLRLASKSDAKILFDWVNRPDSLEMKLKTKNKIDWEEHKAWFESCLNDEDVYIWIIENDKEQVGQIRLIRKSASFELDIYVDEEKRKQGVAQQALHLCKTILNRKFSEYKIVAKILHTNNKSENFFQKSGFELFDSFSEYKTYEYTHEV